MKPIGISDTFPIGMLLAAGCSPVYPSRVPANSLDASQHADGAIYYVQAFCHPGIGDMILREAIRFPIVSLAGKADSVLTPQVGTRNVGAPFWGRLACSIC